MVGYTVKALAANTWPDFARLVEASNGVWGGCWCLWYHGKDHEASPLSSQISMQAGAIVPAAYNPLRKLDTNREESAYVA